MPELSSEQYLLLSNLALALGGATQKAAQPPSVTTHQWHPEQGWVPRAKEVSSTPTQVLGHGSGGIFSAPALERPVFSALLLPRHGLLGALGTPRPSVEQNPLYGIMTGVTAESGSEPTGVCDDPPTSGLMKLCQHYFRFSRRVRSTRVIDISSLGQNRDRADHRDLQLYGNPFTANAQPNVPQMPGGGDFMQALNNEIAKAQYELGATWSRALAAETWTGNPTNNSAGGGTEYFFGLNILINTGYVDAITNVACPAADSIVESFQSVNVATSSSTIVRKLSNIYQRLAYIAAATGLAPVTWALVMPRMLFYELSRIWPLQYNTLFNQNLLDNNTNRVTVLGENMQKERVDMLGNWAEGYGQYLTIDGVRIPVILDDTIAETQSPAGTFTTSIYFVPLTVLGGYQVTFLEYFDFNGTGAAIEAARAFGGNAFYQASDNGRFLWHFRPPLHYCVQAEALLKMRIILLTPQLAARLTNVAYIPVEQIRGWSTSNTSYYADGGGTTIAGLASQPASFYAPNTGNGT